MFGLMYFHKGSLSPLPGLDDPRMPLRRHYNDTTADFHSRTGEQECAACFHGVTNQLPNGADPQHYDRSQHNEGTSPATLIVLTVQL